MDNSNTSYFIQCRFKYIYQNTLSLYFILKPSSLLHHQPPTTARNIQYPVTDFRQYPASASFGLLLFFFLNNSTLHFFWFIFLEKPPMSAGKGITTDSSMLYSGRLIGRQWLGFFFFNKINSINTNV